MNQPAPVDLNKLKNILAKSKAVMKKTESDDYTTGHVDGSTLVQETTDNIPANASRQASISVKPITESMIDNSRLPEAIKQAMKMNPIPQPTMNHTFNLEDVSDLVEKNIPVPQSRPRQQVSENFIQHQSSLSEDKIRLIVQEEMTKFFSGYFMKNITETIQKDTIKNLLEKGVIKKKTPTK
jgi:hypothetical protein